MGGRFAKGVGETRTMILATLHSHTSLLARLTHARKQVCIASHWLHDCSLMLDVGNARTMTKL
jgi:hypothetical protein